MIVKKRWSNAGYIMLFVSLLISSIVNAETARQVAEKTFPSAVLLIMRDLRGQPICLGSGFFVREGIVATNFHVIEGASSGYAKFVRGETKYNIAGLVGIDSKRDLALLSIMDARAPSLLLGNSNQVAVGDEIYVVGNPQGFEGTFSQGIISGIRHVGLDTLFQITAPISPGSSGGPVVNPQGEVIGVAVGTFQGGQNLNFAIPVSYVASLLSEIGRITPLSSITRPKGQKHILADLGGPNTEGVVVENLRLEKKGMFVSFSLRNRLQKRVSNIHLLVIFYDRNNNVIHYEEDIYKDVFSYSDDILPGLAKSTSIVCLGAPSDLTARIRLRVLDFKITD